MSELKASLEQTLKFHVPLTVEELRGEDIPEPWTYGIRYRTTFGELDAQGHVSNVVYLRWFEALRMQYLRDYGWPEYATRDGTPMVLRRNEVDYLKVINLSQDIVVTGRTTRVGTSSCVMEYAVWSMGLCATGAAVLVFLDNDNAKSAIPEALKANILERDLNPARDCCELPPKP
jgi:acyl-CoA thioester hydrolase